MTAPTDTELARDAINKWGHWEQVRQAQEECTELALALRHWERGKVGSGAVATEIADVEIVLEQLRMMVPRDLLDLAREQQRAKQRRAISGDE